MIDYNQLSEYLINGLQIAAYNAANQAYEILLPDTSEAGEKRKIEFASKFSEVFANDAGNVLTESVKYIINNADITGSLPVLLYDLCATAIPAPTPAVKGTTPGMLKIS